MDDHSFPRDVHRGPAVRVYVFEVNETARRGLQELLVQAGFEVVGSTTRPDEAARHAAELKPDVCVVDLGQPGRTGIEVCREVKAAVPHIPCLLHAATDDAEARRRGSAAGAKGYVLKQISGAALIAAILEIVAEV